MCALTTANQVECWSADKPHESSSVILGRARAPIGVETSALCATSADDAVPDGARKIVAGGLTCLLAKGGTVACTGVPARDGAEIDTVTFHALPGVSGARDLILDPYEWCVESADATWTCSSRERESGPGDRPSATATTAHTTALAQNRFALCSSDASGHAACRSRGPDGSTEDVALTDVQKISVGNNHACALQRSGRLVCWGANELGQASGRLGTTRESAPVPVTSDVMDVAVGLSHTCVALREGSVVCFGDNGSGQLGVGNTDAAPGLVRVVGLNRPVRRVTAGFDHTCVLTDEARVLCWGSDSKKSAVPREEALLPRELNGLPLAARDIAAGGDRTCALLMDGSIACWGLSKWWNADEDGRPKRVDGTEGSVELGTGDDHACARTAGGLVRCWGWNQQGQLGVRLSTRQIVVRPPKACPYATYTTEQVSRRALEVDW
jgi:alpha-tubulin suppressor-like RCC1 family protein